MDDWTTQTRSGKNHASHLEKVAEGAVDQLGDVSTLADHTVIESLVENRKTLA